MQPGRLAMSFCGSPAYLSPEVINNKGSGIPADIYGIGTLLFELLTGLPPYYNNDIDALYNNITNGKLKFPNYIGGTAKNLIKKILNKNPDKRPNL